MEISESARRHSVDDEDMRHAVDNAIRVISLDELVMFVGGDRRGRLLEVGVAVIGDRPVIVHAMPARQRFLR